MNNRIMPIAKRIAILVAVGLVAVCDLAQGGSLSFTNQAPAGASWFVAGNWRNTAAPFASTVPTIADTVYISSLNGPGTAIVDGPGAVVNGLYLGYPGGGYQANLKVQPGGELNVNDTCIVGHYSPAQLMITGGVINGLKKFYIGSNPPGAAAPCVIEVVQYAGDVFVTGEVHLNETPGSGNYAPGYPRYKLVEGRIEAERWSVGYKGYGKVEVEGGTNYLRNALTVGALTGGDGIYLQSGGLVDPYSVYIGNSGAKGRYELSGGSLNCRFSDMYCGADGEGTFIQSGGTNTIVRSCLYIGIKAMGTGHYQISGGKLLAYAGITVGTNGTFKIIGGAANITCSRYAQHAHSTLDLHLTNGVVSPIAVSWATVENTLNGTLNVTLQGSPDSYPNRSSVVTVMTYPSGGYSGTFNAVNLAPANKLLGVRVNYNATSVTLDQWQYVPSGTLMTIR